MEIAEHIEQLQAEGLKLAAGAQAAGLDAAVPGCPGWAVRDLLAHIGEVHRWAGAIVAGGLAMPRVEPPTVPPDAELVDWYHAGHTALLEALRAAPPDLECFTFLPAPSQLAFWARRQALETAIHRADAEGAAGSVSPYDDALALDGMSELLVGFGARKKEFEPGTLRLEPHGGPSWLVSLGPVGMTATAEGPGTPADATVTGSPSDVYRWMWNRPADVSVTGSAAVAKQWQKIQIRWS